MRLPGPDDASALASYVDTSAALLGLRIDPELRAGVMEHVAFLASAMALLEGLALPEDVEPGPVFQP